METRGHRILLLFVCLLAAGMILACDLGGLLEGESAVPSVVIERPPSDVRVNLGDTVAVHATATDSTGVTRAELWVDGTMMATESSPVGEGQTSFSVILRWRPVAQGPQTVVVKAYNASGDVGESSAIIVFVVEGGARPEITPPGLAATPSGPQPTQQLPEPTPAVPQQTPASQPPATATPPPPPTNTPVPPVPTNTAPSGPCLPTTVTTINVGGHPKGVAVHGQMLYVALHDAPMVKVINTNNNTVVDTLDTGVTGAQQGNGVVVHPSTGWVYVANKSDNSVSAIDPSGAASAVIVTTNGQPFGLAAAGQYVYVADFAADRVGRINVNTYAFQSIIGTFHEPCLLGALGQDVFVPTNGAGPIYRIGPAGSPVAIGQDKTGYFAVAANPTSNRVFVTDRDGGDLIKIDANANSVEGKVHIPQRPYGGAVNSPKGRVYVIAAEADLLYVIKGPSLQIIGSVPVGGQGAAEGGQGIAVSGDRIYVSNYQDGTVTVLNDACP